MTRSSNKSKDTALKALKTLKKFLSSDESLADLKKVETHLSKVNWDDFGSESSSSGNFSLPSTLKDKFDFIGFSDGACRGNPGPGAWGAIVQNPQEEVLYEGNGLEVLTTNNKMELQGALEAMKFVASEVGPKLVNQTKIVIVSDSKYVVDGMNSWVQGWKNRGWKKADKKVPENVEIWQELDEVRHYFDTCVFQWVKGHAGHPQNERCDEIANQALDEAGF